MNPAQTSESFFDTNGRWLSRLTKFPLDREIGAHLAVEFMVVEGVLPAAVLVFSRGK